jgi:hypothetical protein
MNYLAAFILCISFTVLSALGGETDWRWLVVSDVNVAIWLWVAWWLGKRRRP